MKITRKIIEIDEDLCNGCGLCAEACSEGAIRIIDGKARLVAEKYCDGLGACIGECPQGAVRIVEREADAFDAAAVEEYLKGSESTPETKEATMACGCPSTHIQEFESASARAGEDKAGARSKAPSCLTHWPVQIRLVPATASFLQGARLLIAADCATVACPNLHDEFLKDRVVMIGCPKFDDPGPYVQKFADIFTTNTIRDVTVLVMEVPCCQGLPRIVQKGMEAAGRAIPMEKVVINARGDRLTTQRMAMQSPAIREES